MYKGLINPKEFIKNTQSHEDYICNICYQICVRPALCEGSCKKIFCLKCVSESRLAHDRCPMRCSSPFNVEILPELNIEFQCPYNSSECKTLIHSLDQFNDHYKNCPYVPEQELYFKKMKNEFRCLNGHQLQFFIGSFQEMCHSNCTLCQQKKLCRAICRQCNNSLFCVQCREPPCQKGKCPIGHQMKLWKSSNLAYICDLCGISTAISKSNVYDDTQCNFGICGDCFQSMAKKAKKNELKIKVQSNKHDQCQKGHKLTISTDLEIFFQCSKCKKTKQCVKECKECFKKYCLSCKVAQIQGDETCFQNHCFYHISTETFSPEKLENFRCMKCQKISNLILYDGVCRIRLCPDCLMYGIILASEKQRFIENIYCKKNHILRYMNNPNHHEGFCTSCKRKMPAKLFCDFCDIKQQCYCCACKPLAKFQTCYFGHKLIEIVATQNVPCCLCGLRESSIVGCKKCTFFICKNCQDQYDSSKPFYKGENWMQDQSQQCTF